MSAPRDRLVSIDAVRGAIMVVMALDHVRDFFSDSLWFDPADVTKTTPALFLTRWITHLCAPGFVLVAGLGAALAEQRGLPKRRLSVFLATRGLWLVCLELSLVRLGFYFSFDFHEIIGLVMWVLGASMICLAGLIYLPRSLLAGLSLALIVGHNLFDSVVPEQCGSFGDVWKLVHYFDPKTKDWSRNVIDLGGGFTLFAPYKLVPWVGVMALGYLLGPAYRNPPAVRRRWLISGGLTLVAAFLALRGFNAYGDPNPWSRQENAGWTMLSFLNCTKYPPSLCYLLMTLGPILILLGRWDRSPGPVLSRLAVVGRAPLFFYLLHLPLIHGLAVLTAYLDSGRAPHWLTAPPALAQAPPGYGYGLEVVYLVWALVVLMLYPLCVAFADLKRRDRSGLLSYL